MGRGVAQAVSTVMLSVLILAVGWISVPWIGPQTIDASRENGKDDRDTDDNG